MIYLLRNMLTGEFSLVSEICNLICINGIHYNAAQHCKCMDFIDIIAITRDTSIKPKKIKICSLLSPGPEHLLMKVDGVLPCPVCHKARWYDGKHARCSSCEHGKVVD